MKVSFLPPPLPLRASHTRPLALQPLDSFSGGHLMRTHFRPPEERPSPVLRNEHRLLREATSSHLQVSGAPTFTCGYGTVSHPHCFPPCTCVNGLYTVPTVSKQRVIPVQPLTTPSAHKHYPRYKKNMLSELFELFNRTVFDNKVFFKSCVYF